jgi:hypothetical protein
MRRPGRRHRGWAGALLGLALLLPGCTTTAAELPDDPLPAAFDDGVPAPDEDVVLTVEGATETHDWDLPTLALLPQHDLTIVEPFLEVEHTYTGPLWSDVLRASGVDLDRAETTELVALDDYVADLQVSPQALGGLVLARLEDGEEIPLEAGGPIRFVFPPDNPSGDNANNWIWSLRWARVS